METVSTFFRPGSQAAPRPGTVPIVTGQGQTVSPYQGAIIQTGFKKPDKTKPGIFKPRIEILPETKEAPPVLTTKPGMIIKQSPAPPDESPALKFDVGPYQTVKPYQDSQRPKTVGGWALGLGIVIGGLILLRVFKN